MPGKSLRELRRRIRAVTNIAKLTDAMKKVAAARLRRAQRQLSSTRPYIEKLFSMTESILFPSLVHPFFEQREVKRGGIIVITSERGLCGGYNMNVLRQAENLARELPDALLFVVGRVGLRYFTGRNYKISYSCPFPPIGFAPQDILSLAEVSLEAFLKREIDTLYIVYTHFYSPGGLIPTVRRLLPMEKKAPERDVISEPSLGVLLEDLLPRYFHMMLFQAMLEAMTSEQSARFVAMDMATQNANRLLQDLRIRYNKERQALITKEITEIMGGAEALKEG